jgi:hypothetical protein
MGLGYVEQKQDQTVGSLQASTTVQPCVSSRVSTQCSYDDLLITIQWKDVVFTQDPAHFSGSPPTRLPQSQILFRTHFHNRTSNEQSYLFKAERCTRSLFAFTFTQSLSKSDDASVSFRLPEAIVQCGGGIKQEQTVAFGQDT